MRKCVIVFCVDLGCSILQLLLKRKNCSWDCVHYCSVGKLIMRHHITEDQHTKYFMTPLSQTHDLTSTIADRLGIYCWKVTYKKPPLCSDGVWTSLLRSAEHGTVLICSNCCFSENTWTKLCTLCVCAYAVFVHNGNRKLVVKVHQSRVKKSSHFSFLLAILALRLKQPFVQLSGSTWMFYIYDLNYTHSVIHIYNLIIRYLFQSTITNGHLPTEWCTHCVVPIWRSCCYF